jgi:hypothetical protein
LVGLSDAVSSGEGEAAAAGDGLIDGSGAEGEGEAVRAGDGFTDGSTGEGVAFGWGVGVTKGLVSVGVGVSAGIGVGVAKAGAFSTADGVPIAGGRAFEVGVGDGAAEIGCTALKKVRLIKLIERKTTKQPPINVPRTVPHLRFVFPRIFTGSVGPDPEVKSGARRLLAGGGTAAGGGSGAFGWAAPRERFSSGEGGKPVRPVFPFELLFDSVGAEGSAGGTATEILDPSAEVPLSPTGSEGSRSVSLPFRRSTTA